MLFIQKWTGFYYGRTLEKSSSKGQQISKQNCPAVTSPKGGICFSILTRWKYLKLQIEIQVSIISESSGQKNKFILLFFGRSLGSTILFQDLLTNSSCFNHIKSKDFIMTIETIYMISFWCPHLNLTAATDRGAVHL